MQFLAVNLKPIDKVSFVEIYAKMKTKIYSDTTQICYVVPQRAYDYQWNKKFRYMYWLSLCKCIDLVFDLVLANYQIASSIYWSEISDHKTIITR